MKKLFLYIAICLSTTALAQSDIEDLDMIQSFFGKEKKMMMSEFVQLNSANKDAFWFLYDEYEVKRKNLGKRRLALLQKYSDNYLSLDDKVLAQIIKETISLGREADNLIVKYYKKMDRATGTKSAAQFYQLELYFVSAIRNTILESIPFIGELDPYRRG